MCLSRRQVRAKIADAVEQYLEDVGTLSRPDTPERLAEYIVAKAWPAIGTPYTQQIEEAK